LKIRVPSRQRLLKTYVTFFLLTREANNEDF
jgi:hypothetical protein